VLRILSIVIVNCPMDLLLTTLRTGDPLAQAEAARLLGEASALEAIPALLEYVEGCQQFHKSAGFTALGRMGDSSVCDRVYALMEDARMRDDWYWFGWRSVRAAAAHALLMLGDDRGTVFLKEIAEKEDDVFYAWFAPAILRLEAGTSGLADLKDYLTVERLLSVPENSTRLTDPSRLTAVIEALGEIGGKEAASKAAEFIEHSSRFVRGQVAISTIQASGTNEFTSFVEKMSREDPTDFARARAAFALKDADFLELLVQGSEDSFARAVALEGLGLLGASGKAPCALRAVDDPDTYVRQCALEALERINAPEAAAAARDRLSDEALNVRCQAEKTLIVMERSD